MKDDAAEKGTSYIIFEFLLRPFCAPFPPLLRPFCAPFAPLFSPFFLRKDECPLFLSLLRHLMEIQYPRGDDVSDGEVIENRRIQQVLLGHIHELAGLAHRTGYSTSGINQRINRIAEPHAVARRLIGGGKNGSGRVPWRQSNAASPEAISGRRGGRALDDVADDQVLSLITQ